MNKWVAKLVMLFVVTLTILFCQSTHRLPSFGNFISPFTGFWQNAEKRIPDFQSNLKLSGLKNSVTIKWDYNMVPHIFALNEEDMIFAQGYVTASMRLFQMEYLYRQAAGRLAEIAGPAFVDSDRLYRRMGFKRASILQLEELKNNKQLSGLIQAYCNGVNAYINSLSYRDLPVEYKLLSCKPELWEPLDILLIHKNFAFIVAGHDNDLKCTNSASILRESSFMSLFFSVLPNDVPVVNTNYLQGNSNKKDTCHLSLPGLYIRNLKNIQPTSETGSNSWAISGTKTSTGKPVLCTDIHAPLKLPGMWFDIQLKCPDFSVYGASFPGIPFVFMGINDHIAWGGSNSTRDLKDWYTVEFTDAARTIYKFKGKQLKCQIIKETIKVRAGKDYQDTIRITEAGPLIYENSFLPTDSLFNDINLAVDWAGNEKSIELKAIYGINKAKSLKEFQISTQLYFCPGFNLTVATRSGDIGIFHQGRFFNHPPLHGTTVMNMDQYPDEPVRWIPSNDNPQEINPKKGFVLATNQSPTNSTYPYWCGGTMEYFRNRRINAILNNINHITPEQNKLIQNDQYYLMAAEVLPKLLKSIDKNSLNKPFNQYYRILHNWDMFATPQSKAMTLFNIWWNKVRQLTWDELDGNANTIKPSDAVLMNMILNDPDNNLFDSKNTAQRENATDIINLAFNSLPGKLIHRHDIPEWSKTNKLRLDYFNIDAFSKKDIKLGGCEGTVNMNSGNKGVVYRMIISLEDEPFAWGIQPGGQSGNPGSYFFNNQTENWSTGNYYDWIILKSENEINNRIRIEQRIQPAR